MSRNNGKGAFTQAAMLGGGAHGGGAAGDRRWGSTFGANAEGMIVQFYIEAADKGDHIRRFPSPLPGGAVLERRLRGGDRLPAAGPGP